MAIIKQYDKRSGITYIYESHAYWDPDKKTSRAKRKLIGRYDPETGEIIPTDGRNRKTGESKQKTQEKDFEKLYQQLLKRCMAQEALITSLKKQLEEVKRQ